MLLNKFFCYIVQPLYDLFFSNRNSSSALAPDLFLSFVSADFLAICITSAQAGSLVIIGLVMGIFGLNCSNACKDRTCKKYWGKTGGVCTLAAGKNTTKLLCSLLVGKKNY